MSLLNKESYKHRAAKWILKKWLSKEFQVITEMELGNGSYIFRPDITVLKDGHIQAFYEITHLHPIDAEKLSRMQYYCYVNKVELLLHEVSADWILNLCEEPEYIEKFTFDLSFKEPTKRYD